jgi:flavin-binding protein dodecin
MGSILNAPTGTTMTDMAGKLFEDDYFWDKPLDLGGPVRRAGAPPLNIEGESIARWKAGVGVDTLAPGWTFRHRHLERGRAMSVAKVTELSVTSTKSFEDAIQQGVERATKTLRNVKSAWVKEMRVSVENNKVSEYQVNMQVTFVLDE